MDQHDDLLTVTELAAYLRKSPSTIYRLARQGRLPGQKIGGTWRFSRRRLEAWRRRGLWGGGRGRLNGYFPATRSPRAGRGPTTRPAIVNWLLCR